MLNPYKDRDKMPYIQIFIRKSIFHIPRLSAFVSELVGICQRTCWHLSANLSAFVSNRHLKRPARRQHGVDGSVENQGGGMPHSHILFVSLRAARRCRGTTCHWARAGRAGSNGAGADKFHPITARSHADNTGATPKPQTTTTPRRKRSRRHARPLLHHGGKPKHHAYNT